MSEDAGPFHIVVMGVSGAGKTTIATGIAAEMGWDFAEGDSFHPEANVKKMAAGTPLDDDDRWPWLRAIGTWIDERGGRSAVITCSALKRAYRDLLCEGRPSVRFCELDADENVIGPRIEHRQGHYMPASLLPSQFATLEPLQPDEPGVHISVAGTPEEAVQDALRALDLHPPGSPS
jgi:gluconokinase